MLAVATCSGTDQKLIMGKMPWDLQYPVLLGHESIGRVIKTGSRVRYLKEGDVVLRPTALYPVQRLGQYESMMGGFAEYGLVTDTRALLEDEPGTDLGYAYYQLPVPAEADILPEDALMLITLKETAGFLMNLRFSLNTPLVILGSASVAQAMCFFAKLLGAVPLIVVGRRDEPLDEIRRFGADYTVNTTRQDMVAAVMEWTGGRGAELVCDAAGDECLIREALRLLSPTGRIAPYATFSSKDPLVGIPPERLVQADTGEVPAHEYLLDLVGMGVVDLSSFYSHQLPFEDIVRGFELLFKKQAVKVVFTISD